VTDLAAFGDPPAPRRDPYGSGGRVVIPDGAGVAFRPAGTAIRRWRRSPASSVACPLRLLGHFCRLRTGASPLSGPAPWWRRPLVEGGPMHLARWPGAWILVASHQRMATTKRGSGQPLSRALLAARPDLCWPPSVLPTARKTWDPTPASGPAWPVAWGGRPRVSMSLGRRQKKRARRAGWELCRSEWLYRLVCRNPTVLRRMCPCRRVWRLGRGAPRWLEPCCVELLVCMHTEKPAQRLAFLRNIQARKATGLPDEGHSRKKRVELNRQDVTSGRRLKGLAGNRLQESTGQIRQRCPLGQRQQQPCAVNTAILVLRTKIKSDATTCGPPQSPRLPGSKSSQNNPSAIGAGPSPGKRIRWVRLCSSEVACLTPLLDAWLRISGSVTRWATVGSARPLGGSWQGQRRGSFASAPSQTQGVRWSLAKSGHLLSGVQRSAPRLRPVAIRCSEARPRGSSNAARQRWWSVQRRGSGATYRENLARVSPLC